MTMHINGFIHHTIDIDGTITNTKTGKIKSVWKAKNGYLCVDIHEQGKQTKHYLHRLLAIHYIDNPENKRTVNHIDGDKLNNDITNLEWATDAENIKHAYDNNLNSGNKKITDNDYKNILDKFFQGYSLTEIIEDYDFSLTTFSTYITKYLETNNLIDAYNNEKQRQKSDRNKHSKQLTYKVKAVDKNNSSIVLTFNSISEATRKLGKKSSGPISNAISGKAKTAYGYYWERI